MSTQLTREQLHELAIDTMASWALEGMEPTPQTVQEISDLINGKVTLDEFIAKVKRDSSHA